MEPGVERISEFHGVALDAHRSKLPPGYFQVDEGGDRFARGAWRRRRGQRRTDAAQEAAAITTLIGFELPGAGFGLAMVAGATATGLTNVAQQSDGSDEEGFGEGGVGEGGFGE